MENAGKLVYETIERLMRLVSINKKVGWHWF
jgi:hypothetical protein